MHVAKGITARMAASAASSCIPAAMAAPLLPGRHAGPGEDRGDIGIADAGRGDGRGERQPQAGDGGAHPVPRSAARCRARPSPCSASPSSPIPTTCKRGAESGDPSWRWPRAPGSAPDPVGMKEAARPMPEIVHCDDAYRRWRRRRPVILTEWNSFRALDPVRMKQLMKAPVMVVISEHLHAPTRCAHSASPTQPRPTLECAISSLNGGDVSCSSGARRPFLR